MSSFISIRRAFRKFIQWIYGPVTDEQVLDMVKDLRDHTYKLKCASPTITTRDYEIDPDKDLEEQMALIMEIEMTDRDNEYKRLKALD